MADNGLRFDSWGVESDKIGARIDLAQRETGRVHRLKLRSVWGRTFQSVGPAVAQGTTAGSAVQRGPVKYRTGHDHANRTTQHH
jgi:hypothetical protein